MKLPTKAGGIARIASGIRNFDSLLSGGLPIGSVVVLGGPPGSGKTILAQQIGFHNATPEGRALFFNTLSEPTAKTLKYASQFNFFDRSKLDDAVRFVDLGVLLRKEGLAPVTELIIEQVKAVKPALIVIDSFKAFGDLARSSEDLRKFGYELAVNLMAWETTALLLGEYARSDFESNPIFSIVDGLVMMSRREVAGEQHRLVQVVKMRGTDHSTDEHPFAITSDGIDVYAPRVAIQRTVEPTAGPPVRKRTGIPSLDALLGDGIPAGSSLLVSGVAGSGKTVLLLEFLYRGAQAGETGILFSFEETDERLRATARGMGWDLDGEIERGRVEIVYVPQPEVLVEKHLLLMRQRIEAIGATRVAIDSVSVFLYKLAGTFPSREKVYQLASIVQNAGAVGLFATDIPYGSSQISRFGVEETVVDGVILLSSSEKGLERDRFLEVYKLRNTAHATGRHPMTIAAGGIKIVPRRRSAPAPVKQPRRRPRRP